MLNPKVKLIYLESPTNPNLNVVDIVEIVKLIKEYNKDIFVALDNTFLSPYNFKPLKYGVDIKGHNDVVMGAVNTQSDDLYEKIHTYQIFDIK